MATESRRNPELLGVGKINDPGTVFTDAKSKEGTKLTARKKNIIEAHEKGHGLRDFTSLQDMREVRSVIDLDALQDLQLAHEFGKKTTTKFPANYIKKPEEIIERMAQLKNYFGMSASEEFTVEHLNYARENYVKDTGLDNTVSEFLYCISPKTEDAFLSVINKYPI